MLDEPDESESALAQSVPVTTKFGFLLEVKQKFRLQSRVKYKCKKIEKFWE